MRRTLASAAFLAAAISVNAQAWSEGFDDITTLAGSGWFQQNNSEPIGLSNWFQGNPAIFAAHSGAANSYIGANFENGAGLATISNWLVTPTATLNNGDVLTFWTRGPAGSTFPDRLEIRMSTAGASTNVGTSSTDVGDFTNLLTSINPNLDQGGYPTDWTEFNVTVSGLAGPVSGRFAFRYFVTAGGPSGTNSDFIGIDTASYTPVPEPATMIALGAGALSLIARRRRKA